MPGTVEGGKKAAATNIKRHGKSFYANIGRKGGAKGVGPDYQAGGEKASGFAYLKDVDPEKFHEASAKGGFISRRKRQST